MPDPQRQERTSAEATRAPWTQAGGPDPAFDDLQRRTNHRLLTDPVLAARYARRHPDRPYADYDEMIRALGYVWECRHDDTLNVTGYLCNACGEPQSRAGT
jgi:hypothetical protein